MFILHILRLIRVLPSHPRFTLISAFYPFIRVLPSYPCFTLLSVRPSVRVLHFHPYPRFTLTLLYPPIKWFVSFVSNDSVVFHETIVLYPPIVWFMSSVSNDSAVCHETIIHTYKLYLKHGRNHQYKNINYLQKKKKVKIIR